MTAEEFILSLPADTGIIAIDGRCGAGKTTLAEKIRQKTGAQIVHTDDFFLPPALRTEKRLSEPGGNIHYERLKSEVIDKLSGNEDIVYKKFDCTSMTYKNEVHISPRGIIVLEGSYSHHPFFGSCADIKIFLDIMPEEQQRRLIKREGKEKAAVFRNRWIPLEEKYFRYFGIREKADIIIG